MNTKLTSDKIDLFEAIINGEEFLWMGERFKLVNGEIKTPDGYGGASLDAAGAFLVDFMADQISLSPKAIKSKLRDQMGQLLWTWVTDKKLNSNDHSLIFKAGLIKDNGLTKLGKQILADWLKKN